eukprot:1152662-Pelagomonas_calceolata.AAC.3
MSRSRPTEMYVIEAYVHVCPGRQMLRSLLSLGHGVTRLIADPEPCHHTDPGQWHDMTWTGV